MPDSLIAQEVKRWVADKSTDYEYHRWTKKEWFDNGDNRTRTQILASLGVNGKLLQGKLLLEVQPPFVVIEDALNDIRSQFPGIEPENLGEMRTESGKPRWLPPSERLGSPG